MKSKRGSAKSKEGLGDIRAGGSEKWKRGLREMETEGRDDIHFHSAEGLGESEREHSKMERRAAPNIFHGAEQARGHVQKIFVHTKI